MPDYRRNRVPGGTYFFTVALLDRRADLLVRHVDVLREVVRRVKLDLPFHIDAWVVLPEHMHCVWTLPPGDVNFSGRWWAIKMRFSKALPNEEARSAARARRRERGVWQRRFWEHTIRDERDYGVHVDYTHFNPVKHGYAASPGAWAFSSFRACVRRGVYPAGWAEDGGDLNAGERG
jgi:putative transposase